LTNSASINLPKGTLVSGVSHLAFYVEHMDFNNKKSIFGEESVRKCGSKRILKLILTKKV